MNTPTMTIRCQPSKLSQPRYSCRYISSVEHGSGVA